MPSNVTVVVVDDHPLYRRGVVEAIQSRPDIEVVGEAADAADGIQKVNALLPDIVLLDLGIPGGGVAAAKMIARLSPATRIVILTASEDEEDLKETLEAGAKAYVVKGVSGDELVSILSGVARGDVYVTPSLAAALLISGREPRRRISWSDPLAELTDREAEVLDLVAEAFSNKELAARLEISEKTVKHHVTNILEKLQARNRVEAALLARRRKASSLEV